MYNRRIERSREARLWLTQVIFPIGFGIALLYNTNHGFNNWVNQKAYDLKDKYLKTKAKIKNKELEK